MRRLLCFFGLWKREPEPVPISLAVTAELVRIACNFWTGGFAMVRRHGERYAVVESRSCEGTVFTTVLPGSDSYSTAKATFATHRGGIA